MSLLSVWVLDRSDVDVECEWNGTTIDARDIAAETDLLISSLDGKSRSFRQVCAIALAFASLGPRQGFAGFAGFSLANTVLVSQFLLWK
jgi:hypothetical protein